MMCLVLWLIYPEIIRGLGYTTAIFTYQRGFFPGKCTRCWIDAVMMSCFLAKAEHPLFAYSSVLRSYPSKIHVHHTLSLVN